ncbi:hypothetical protein VITU102760_24910 [Vibrio tubiashii]|uniref:Uncharacterized protein n=1 Tax=Vibrio tubiashii ATCC 19109 TaxID=1051646 RepID=A0ABN0DG41_9VIBR|nr:hypothetical protein VITU9109_02787 [Vibrio tubiashii ATCC 19109]
MAITTIKSHASPSCCDTFFVDAMRTKPKMQDGKSIRKSCIRFRNRLDLALFLMEFRDWRKSKNV